VTESFSSQPNQATQPAWTIPGYLEIRDNHLHINGVDAVRLAEEFDTPLFVISAPRIRRNIARLLEAASHHEKIKLCYASKANNLLGALRVVREAGIDVEVNSGGELFRAMRAGFRPDQIEMNGISKTEGELAEAIEAGIYAINVDSPFELELIERVAAKTGKRANVTIRLVAGVGTRSHAGLQTALYTSKPAPNTCWTTWKSLWSRAALSSPTPSRSSPKSATSNIVPRPARIGRSPTPDTT
jgi:diaminopimelate decarboxylase